MPKAPRTLLGCCAALLANETRPADRHGLSFKGSVSVGMTHRQDGDRRCPCLAGRAAVAAVTATPHRRGCFAARGPPAAPIRGCRPTLPGWHVGQGRPPTSPPASLCLQGPCVARGSCRNGELPAVFQGFFNQSTDFHAFRSQCVSRLVHSLRTTRPPRGTIRLDVPQAGGPPGPPSGAPPPPRRQPWRHRQGPRGTCAAEEMEKGTKKKV